MTFVLIFLIVLLAACVVQWLAADCWGFKKFFSARAAGLPYMCCVRRDCFVTARFSAHGGAPPRGVQRSPFPPYFCF